MRRNLGGLPPRYGALLRLTLAAAAFRLAPLVPVLLVYFLIPAHSWLRLLLVAYPVLWVLIVCPARVRYGQRVAALAEDPAAPLSARALLTDGSVWCGVCRGRIQLMRRWALPLVVLLAILIALFVFFNAFTVLGMLLIVFRTPVILAIVLMACVALFGWSVFQTSAYRFGYTRRPKAGALKPLLKQNLLWWLPTLALLFALLAVGYRELGLLGSNLLGAAPLFSVKLRPFQLILLLLTVVSYLLLLPVRKYNAAVWAQAQK